MTALLGLLITPAESLEHSAGSQLFPRRRMFTAMLEQGAAALCSIAHVNIYINLTN